MRKAPWPDYNGSDIFEGSTIEHPSGQNGTVEVREYRQDMRDQWVVNYGDYVVSRLCLQIGDRGRGTVRLEDGETCPHQRKEED